MKKISDCDQEALSLYHYDELDELSTVALQAHLEGCSDCREVLEEMQALNSLRWGNSADQPAVQRIEAEVLRQTVKRRSRFTKAGLVVGGSFAAALLFMLVLKPQTPLPQPDLPPAIFTQVEILEGFDLLEDLELLENFELLTEIEDLG